MTWRNRKNETTEEGRKIEGRQKIRAKNQERFGTKIVSFYSHLSLAAGGKYVVFEKMTALKLTRVRI